MERSLNRAYLEGIDKFDEWEAVILRWLRYTVVAPFFGP